MNKKSIVQKLILAVAVISTAYAAFTWGAIVSFTIGFIILFIIEPAILKLLKL